MSRRLALVLLVVLAVPALALAADTDPKRKINAGRRAQGSVDRPQADRLRGRLEAHDDAERRRERQLSRFNPDESDLTLTGEAEAEFERTEGFPSVFSYADVYVSKRGCGCSRGRGRVKPALARCLAHFFQRGVAESRRRRSPIVNARPDRIPEASRRATAAFRVVANDGRRAAERQDRRRCRSRCTSSSLGHGRGEAGFLDVRPSAPGVAAADLRAFAKLLASR